MKANISSIKRFVVYTAIIGNYDKLDEVRFLNPEIDYVCFTDSIHLNSQTWKVVKLQNEENFDSTTLNRKVKILPHHYLQDYQYSLYVDGHIRLNHDLLSFLNHYATKGSLAVLPHPERDCVYQEGQLCIKSKRGHGEIIQSLLQEYKEEGYPVKNGLYEMGIIFRETNRPEIVNLMETWWGEFSKGAGRDQISFPYSLWKTGFKNFVLINESPRFTDKYFTISFHNQEAKLPFLKKYALYIRLFRHRNPFLKFAYQLLDKVRA